MIINLIKSKQMFSLTLPNKVKGQYWITDVDESGEHRNLISVEGIHGEWMLKSNNFAAIIDGNNEVIKKTVIEPQALLNLKIADSDERVTIFVESIDETRRRFRKVVVKDKDIFFIGRTPDNNFCYENRFVSGKHARLSYDGKNWQIFDNGSTNGTYVNGYSVTSKNLNAGDLIYIMGLKIIVGDNYLAVNNPDNKLRINSNNLWEYIPQQITENAENVELPVKKYFYRSPRFYREVAPVEIKIDAPPQMPKPDTIPVALMIAPSVTMGIASLSTSILTLTNIINRGGEITQAIPSLVMSLSMLLGTILWPLLSKRYEKKQKIKNEQKRQEKYLSYLEGVRDEIKRKCKEQSDILNENIVSLKECIDRIVNVKANLWERYLSQPDFLKLRLGVGNLLLDAKITYGEKKFVLEEDNLQDAMLYLGNEPKQLSNVPIALSLMEKTTVGIYGAEAACIDMIKSLIIQITALHSYDEVKLMLITDEASEDIWNFTRAIPHFWNDDKTERYLATNLDEVKELSVDIEKNVLARMEDDRNGNEYIPHFVIISTNKSVSDKCQALQQLLKKKLIKGASVIFAAPEIKDLPKETKAVVYSAYDKSKLFDRENTTGLGVEFKSEIIDDISINRAVDVLANVELELGGQTYSLPNMVTFLEMFNVSKIEHLNILTRWKENNPTKSLQTPIGVDTYGACFVLDLHEKFHGPHGLVAGMTGSGKSEFIITYILSLAVNYHPDEVAFILIDYKGGGLTGAFEDADRGIKLPHLAGTITNLDGAAVKRSLVSIQSELRRRQAIFNEARKIANEGTMDIYKYQQLYRDKLVKEAIPHLFIISDEFAELKTQQPEFMEQLISAARIGRSLGVHLILATQKPSGVVNDQIWSNSKFRVCLKVQEKADSQDMIKCPDAASLSQTGRFYLQVGFNELFALGQSAWCGAEYVPSEVVEKSVDDSIQIVDNLGRQVIKVKKEKKKQESSNNIKQIVAIVKHLSDIANEENISVRSLWMQPIPPYIYVNDLEQKYSVKESGIILNPVVGEYDDPFNQRQDILTLPITEEGNCIIYGASGNGKTTFLTTLCYSLIKNHTAEELNMYIVDFGAETLRAFESAACVGDVVCASDNEKVINLFKMLNKEIEKRRKLFSEYGGDYMSYCRNSEEILPNIVIVINNIAGFTEQFEQLIDAFALLTRDGVKYGIYFVISANGTNAVRYRILQNFKQMLTMQLNDAAEYSQIVGKTEGILPSKFKGRGLVLLDKVYEFQTAHCADEKDLQTFIRRYAEETGKISGKKAPRIPILPKIVNSWYVEQCIDGMEKIPVGVCKQSLKVETVNLTNKSVLPVVGTDIVEMAVFAEEFSAVLAKVSDTVCIDAEQVDIVSKEKSVKVISEEIDSVVLQMYDELVTRNNDYKDSDMDVSVLDKYPYKVYVVVGVSKFIEKMSRESKEKFNALMERAEAIYKVKFVLVEVNSNISKLTMENWYRKQISGAEGIWIGDGISSQSALKINRITRDLYEDIGSEYGYLVTKNRPVLIKLLSSSEEE